MLPKRYLAKPREVTALQWTGYNDIACTHFLEPLGYFVAKFYSGGEMHVYPRGQILTCAHLVNFEDWLCVNEDGGFFTCNDDNFWDTYEA